MSATLTTRHRRTIVGDPPIAHFLFNNTRSAPLWMALRIWIGLEFFYAGYEKMVGTGWLDGGKSLLGFWKGAVAIPAAGRPAITYTWYRDFLQGLIDSQSYSWFSYIIVFGEIAIGLGLIFGCLTGIAAFFGTVMNFSFMLAGSASTNPVLFGLAIFIILAWKTSGWWGLDRYVLSALGTPWKAGYFFNPSTTGTGPGQGPVPKEATVS